MGVHSGKFGYVNGVDTVGNWGIAETNAPARAIASNTKFAPARREGVLSWTGSYKKYGGIPLHMPGDVFSFQGYTAPDNDVGGTAGVIYSGNAMVNQVAISFDWTTGAIISHVVNFEGHLALSRTSGVMSDATTPDLPPIAQSAGIKWISGLGDITSPFSLANIAQATLTFTSQNQPYVNSSTVIGGRIWTGRKMGPIDWNMACTVQDNVRGTSGLPEVGDDIKIRVYIDDTLFWEIWWGQVRDYTGMSIDRESGNIITATMNLDLNAIFTDGTEGKIVTPTPTTWWPPSAFMVLEETAPDEDNLSLTAPPIELTERESIALKNAPSGAFVRPDPRIILPGVNASPRQGRILDALSMPAAGEPEKLETPENVAPYDSGESFASTEPPEVPEVLRSDASGAEGESADAGVAGN